MKRKQHKKGEIEVGNLLGIGMGLVVLVIGVAYGLQVTGDVKDDMGESNCANRNDGFTNYNATADQCYNSSASHTTVGTAEFNATTDGIAAVSIIPTKLGTIVTILMAAVVIGILVRHLAMKFMG